MISGGLRLVEDDEIDIGGIVQLEGAELAHAENDDTGSFARSLRIDDLELAAVMGAEQQMVDRRRDGGTGELAEPVASSPAHRTSGRDQRAQWRKRYRAWPFSAAS